MKLNRAQIGKVEELIRYRKGLGAEGRSMRGLTRIVGRLAVVDVAGSVGLGVCVDMVGF